MIVGSTVHDVNDDSFGTVDDMLLDDSGAISHVVIDFGSFLGIGSSQDSVGFDDLTILSDSGYTDVRLDIDATREQVQSQPVYSASN